MVTKCNHVYLVLDNEESSLVLMIGVQQEP